MSPRIQIPELLAPAGSLDAVRAAVANGADAIYLGAEKFNARDEGAQLSLDELETACAIAHGRGVRVYLTLNTLVKPAELEDALAFLGEAIDRGIDAAIVQDIGIIRLIQRVYPGFEIHGSTQMTVHDASGAAVMKELGIERIVLARENTIEDVRAIRAAVPDLGIETFIHGALCISYSGQCYMSGMISERSANRGSCAQSCRKDYVLRDAGTNDVLDQGHLISAKDLGAYDSLADIADAGVGCLKIEGRKKKPEYVATVTRGYRDFLSRLEQGDRRAPTPADVEPLVQIYSRGFTPGMYQGRQGREYITRDQPDNRGIVLGMVVEQQGREVIVEVSSPLAVGDGIALEPPVTERADVVGGSVQKVRTLHTRDGMVRQALTMRVRGGIGWTVVRSSHAALLQRAQASYANVSSHGSRKHRLDVSVFGSAGSPLKLVFKSGDYSATVQSDIPLAPASKRSLDEKQLRDQLGRLGDTAFSLGAIETAGLRDGLFLPVSELNRLRQDAVETLSQQADWDTVARTAERAQSIAAHVHAVSAHQDCENAAQPSSDTFVLSAQVYNVDDARIAADAGATEIVLDPFLRHPTPPVSRVKALAEELAGRGVGFRIRTPSVVRPEERRSIDKWITLGFPIVSGHLGLVAELAKGGRSVVADYSVNVFNQHTAAEIFRFGAERVMPSIELTLDELTQLVSPWNGQGFDVMVYGRPEGMTIEHCVLSAAFDREPTTCRDLCVQKHANVALTDPAGYTFAVATDSACRNRLLHSRPVEGSEYLPKLWDMGIRAFRTIFNVPDDDIASIIAGYREMLSALAEHQQPQKDAVRIVVGQEFTRGHFVRAV